MAFKKNAAAEAMTEYANAVDPNQEAGVIEFSHDIADAERPPVLPVGEYRATLTGLEIRESQKGNKYLSTKWTISADNQPADYVEALGTGNDKSVFGMVFGCEDNPQSRWNMKEFCKALGAPMSNRINVNDLLNREAIVQVTHGKDLEGNPREQAGRVKPVD